MKINIKRLTETAIIPERGSMYAAGYDLFADLKESVVIKPHETLFIPTGIAIEIPEGYFGGIFARSGLASKEGLRPANCVGVVDSDYRGEVKVALHNDSDVARYVEVGQKVAQMVIIPFLTVDFEEVGELNNTERGVGGFGSTGKYKEV
jgi:dUTP pyrophosphatase